MREIQSAAEGFQMGKCEHQGANAEIRALRCCKSSSATSTPVRKALSGHDKCKRHKLIDLQFAKSCIGMLRHAQITTS